MTGTVDVKYSVFRKADRSNYMVQWTDPETGKKKTRSTGKYDLDSAKREAVNIMGVEGQVDSAGTSTYFILNPASETVKIGVSTNVNKRLEQLQTSTADYLRVVALFLGDIERFLHTEFAHLRRRGEWFVWNSQLKHYARRNANWHDLPKMSGKNSGKGLIQEIHADSVYPMDEFMKRTGLRKDAIRSARADGLNVIKVHGRNFVIGRDWIDYLASK